MCIFQTVLRRNPINKIPGMCCIPCHFKCSFLHVSQTYRRIVQISDQREELEKMELNFISSDFK